MSLTVTSFQDSWIEVTATSDVWITQEYLDFDEAVEFCAKLDNGSILIEPRIEEVFNAALCIARDHLYVEEIWIGIVDTQEEGR